MTFPLQVQPFLHPIPQGISLLRYCVSSSGYWHEQEDREKVHVSLTAVQYPVRSLHRHHTRSGNKVD